MRIPGSTRLEYKHRWKIEGEKNPAFILQEVGGDTDDEILEGRRNENTREDIRKKTKLTTKSHKHGVTKLMA